MVHQAGNLYDYMARISCRIYFIIRDGSSSTGLKRQTSYTNETDIYMNGDGGEIEGESARVIHVSLRGSLESYGFWVREH